MGISIRPRAGGKSFDVDITYTLPGEEVARRYRKVPKGVTSKGAASQWATETLAILMRGEKPGKKEAPTPTFEEFWPRFIENYAKANRQKESTIAAKQTIWRIHLEAALGKKRLDGISDEDVQALKTRLAGKAPKTVNNVLSVLGKMLKVAVKWKSSTGLKALPCEVELVKVQKKKMEHYERDVLERLIVAAKNVDDRAELVVLLGAEAGLRAGEMIGLEWADIDFKANLLTVNRNVWKGVTGAPKGGNSRTIPMTGRLRFALKAQRTLGRGRVLVQADYAGTVKPAVDHWQLRDWMERAQRLAGISTGEVFKGKHRGQRDRGRLHVLRHTFGSHLVQAGVGLLEVKELMGHANVQTTMGYLHLAKGSTAAAIEKLEGARTTETEKERKRATWHLEQGLNPKQKEMLSGTTMKARAR